MDSNPRTPNRPTAVLTPAPYGGPSDRLVNLEIRKESVIVPIYKSTCENCGKRLQHRDEKTLRHNIEQHLVAQHGEDSERRRELEDVKKKLARLAGSLNTRFGI